MILPDSTYMVSRRCSERRFFLRPSDLTNAIVAYCIAYAADKYGVLVHAFCIMSNHLHIVLTDPHCELPQFMGSVNKLIAKAMNASLGRFENFWASESYSSVRLETEEDIIDKMLYVLSNPVESELVDKASKWPGLISTPRQMNAAPLECPMPPVFFRAEGDMPKSVKLHVVPPPGFEGRRGQKLATELSKLLKSKEREVRKKVSREGKSFLGRSAVLSQSPFDRPESFEPRFGLNPRVACRDKWRRIEALQRLKSFLDAYREAWEAFKSGDREVCFPTGTYWMRRHAGMPCIPMA